MYTQLFRRASLIALLLVGSLSACKQQANESITPAPPTNELSSRVAGQYMLTQVSADGEVYSASDAGLKGGAKISRVSAASVDLNLAINTTDNDPVKNASVAGVTLTDAGNNEVDLVSGSERIGKASTNKLTIYIKNSSTGVVYGLIMTK